MTIYSLPNIEKIDYIPQNCVIALGNFDGFHYGHKQIINTAIEKAKKNNLKCMVWTFSKLAKIDSSIPYLSSPEEKLHLISKSGADYVVLEDFESVKTTSANDFIIQTLIKKLKCNSVVCGYNFKFGHNAEGNALYLSKELSKQNIEAIILDPVSVEIKNKKVVISSTAIREAVSSGDMESAQIMLGRPFSIGGIVVDGNHLGRTIGVPTINQNFPKGHIIPKFGVYASKVLINGTEYYGITNIGTKPTVNSEPIVNSETHIFNYSGDLYGKNLRVSIYKRLRGENKFNSIDELSNAIHLDIENAKKYFNL